MAEIRYGLVEGSGKGKEINVAATQTFSRLGGKFCKLVAGNVTLCATGDNIVAGWAETPKDDDGKSSWTSDTTAETDQVFVISGLDNVFELPINEKNASLAASWIGRGAGLLITGATKGKIQKAIIGGNITASPISIVDVDTDNKTVRARVKPGKLQAN